MPGRLKLFDQKYPPTLPEAPDETGGTVVWAGRPWSESWAETSADEKDKEEQRSKGFTSDTDQNDE